MAAKTKYKTYKITCGKCSTYLLTYHKYGTGKGILRLYHSHIVAPESLTNMLKEDYSTINDVPHLRCPNCNELLGTPALSKKKQWVFKMRQGLFHRKLMA